jgi:peptide deformylase
MAILKIARMGHPVLKRRADEVEDPTSPEIAKLIKDMEDTLADVGGVGLAAPQVHVPLRLVIFHVPKARMEDEDGEGPALGVPLTYLINPVIEPQSEEMEEGIEACLSVPGLAGAAIPTDPLCRPDAGRRADRSHRQGLPCQGGAA